MSEPRLIAVSNRIPTGAKPSGGLVVALGGALESTGGIWMGASGAPTDTPRDGLFELESGPFRRMAFDLTPQEQEDYYAGYSNSVLWPLLHSRVDLVDIEERFLAGYKKVNRKIAALVASEARPGDLIWVHDFHLLALAHELRNLGLKNRIGFFLHTPFPSALDMAALPNAVELCRWMTAFDLVGLQARRDVLNFRDTLERVAGARVLPYANAPGEETVVLELEGSVARASAFPVAIEVESFTKVAEAEAPNLDRVQTSPDERLIIGVDRLDYSKGVPQRFLAFEAFLDSDPDWHRHVSLLQIAPPTREGLKPYDDIREELERMAGRINGRFADIDWTPIRYIHRSVPRETLAGLYRRSHIGRVTPLLDGMNLVAKEYVAAQDPNDPGMLILSKFAGAAEQMGEALLVNPHDIAQVADAITTALAMPLSERISRHRALMEGLERFDIDWWSSAFLDALGADGGEKRAAG